MILESVRKCCYTNTSAKIMDFFLSNVTMYFTPLTAALSMELPGPTVKDCMRVLYHNGYLAKLSKDGTVYYITRLNLEKWSTDYRNYLKGQLN